MTPEQQAQAIELAGEGASKAQICRAIGFGASRIRLDRALAADPDFAAAFEAAKRKPWGSDAAPTVAVVDARVRRNDGPDVLAQRELIEAEVVERDQAGPCEVCGRGGHALGRAEFMDKLGECLRADGTPAQVTALRIAERVFLGPEQHRERLRIEAEAKAKGAQRQKVIIIDTLASASLEQLEAELDKRRAAAAGGA